MKIKHERGTVIAVAETLADIKVLIAMESGKVTKEVRVKRKYTKRKYKKECAICGKSYKRLKMHMTAKHGDRTPLLDSQN